MKSDDLAASASENINQARKERSSRWKSVLSRIKLNINGLFGIFGIISILLLLLYRKIQPSSFISDDILGMTAIILIWYTYETSRIRKAEMIISEANRESLERNRQPVIGYSIIKNPENPSDTRFRIENISSYTIAAQVNCNFKIDNELLRNLSPSYDGQHYWNLQPLEVKEGHFSWMDLYVTKDIMPASEKDKINTGSPEDIIKQTCEYIAFHHNFDPPKLTMDIEIYCRNNQNRSTYYLPTHYDYDYARMVWVPTLTSEKPFWDYDSKPSWLLHE